MVEEIRKTQLLLEVVSLGRQQLCLKRQERGRERSSEKSKRTNERIVVRCGQDSEKEHGLLPAKQEDPKNTKEEQRPVQTKTSSQKRTKDHVSELMDREGK